MFKQMMSLLVVAGLVLALAPAAQAAPIVTPGDGWTGDYRLAFVTNGVRGAKSSAIAEYNTFVSTEASLITELNALGATWSVIGSTETVSARENTGTTLTDGGATDVPIYSTTGLRIADGNADLWDQSIQNPVEYGDGTESNPDGAGEHQIWTGTNPNGSIATSGDGLYLGFDTSISGNIRATRGGSTDHNWVSGISDHDGTRDNGRTYTKHFMALSDPITADGGGPPSGGDAIGINFIGGRNSGETNGTVTGIAGVVPQGDWNNVGDSPNSSGGPAALVDDTGAATGATVTWDSTNTYSVNAGAPGDEDSALMKGYLDTNNSAGMTTVTISDVPYGEYDVYLYYDGDAGGGREGIYTVNGVSQGPLSDDGNWPVTSGGGTFALPDANGENGNYTVFSGLTDPNITITADEGIFRAPLNAIQIVNTSAAIPEPSTFALAALGLLGLGVVARRRKRQQ